MNFLDPLFLSSGITGLSLIVIALITRRFPPKEINDLYGYRTRRSKSCNGSWRFAQRYSSELMIWIGAYNCLIGVAGLFIELGTTGGIVISMGFLGGSVIYLFWKTEDELKKRFRD